MRKKEREGEKDKHVGRGEGGKLEQNDSIPFDKDSKEKGKRETDRHTDIYAEGERKRERERGAGQTRQVKRNKERDE